MPTSSGQSGVQVKDSLNFIRGFSFSIGNANIRQAGFDTMERDGFA